MPDNASDVLQDDEVHVWFTRTDSAAPASLLDGQALLSPDERSRHARFRFDRDRQSYLVSHAFVRTTLSRYADVSPAEWRFRENEFGWPSIAAPARHTGLSFNLSHTAGLAVMAVARRREVGIDVESLLRRPVEEDVAGQFFSSIEAAALRAEPPSRRHQVFLEYWTLKESYIKARGMGLAIPLDAFTFHRHAGAPPTIAFAPQLDDDPATWQFVQLQPTPDHLVALAVRRAPGSDVRVTVQDAASAALSCPDSEIRDTG